jgi:hypothetical protein
MLRKINQVIISYLGGGVISPYGYIGDFVIENPCFKGKLFVNNPKQKKSMRI